MEAFREYRLVLESTFPVDVFVSDNLTVPIKVQPHWHDYVEILYFIEGTGLQQVNDHIFYIQKNDVVVLNSNDIHRTECEEGEDVKILVIQFKPDFISSGHTNVFESKYIHAFLSNNQKLNYHIADTMKNSTEVYKLMMGMYSEFLKKDTGYEICIKGMIYQLIACLLRSDMLNLQKPSSFENDLTKLVPLLKHIESCYMEDINLEKASKMLNFSYYYFSRYFKKCTGKSFKEYLDFIRVCEAEKLLLSRDMSISSIGLEVGFSNVSSFNRVFKRIRGYPPTSLKRAKTAKK